ncbi:MAG: hypothetical protein ACREFX_13965 [Opitutaceae bacterium]
MNARTRGVALAAALLLPLRARALFGVGDVVFDPANVTQTINVLRQAQQQVDRLGSLLGVSTRQFDQLVQLTAAVGSASASAPGSAPAGPDRIKSLLAGLAGFGNADPAALLNSSGQLDAFLGVPLSAWVAAVENPLQSFRQVLVEPALERSGSAAGLDGATAAYLQWYAQGSDEDRFNGAGRSASDLAQLMSADWLQDARSRRVDLQMLAAEGQAAETQAAGARTQADQQSAASQLAANTNRILLEAAAQNVGASEAQVRATGAQERLQEDERDSRRNAAEMALDGAD